MSYDSENTDFTKEDAGKWKPPVLDGDLTYAELEERVLAAIGKPGAKIASRTLTQIKLHAGLPAGFDLSPVIEGMLIDRKIRNESNGTITAFFRFADKPEKFHLTGDRQVYAEFVENYRPDPIKTDEQLMAEMRIERRSEKMPDEVGKKKGRTARALDVARLEELAETEPNQSSIAEKLGISVSYLQLKLKEQPETRKAYDRGRAKYVAANPSSPANRRPKPEPTHPVTNGKPREMKQPDLDPAKVEELAAKGSTIKAAAAILGITKYVFKDRLRVDPGNRNYPIREAWYRGVATAQDAGKKRKYQRKTSNKSAEAVSEPVREPLELPTPEPVNTEAADLVDVELEERLFTAIVQKATLIENPADICFNCYDDLPEKPIEIHPFESDETWAFCSESCKDETMREVNKFREDVDREIDNESASDNEMQDIPEFEGRPIVGFSGSIERFEPETESTENPTVLSHGARQRVQSRYITFEDGSQLLVGFEGNFFEMTPNDRKLLDAIAGMIQNYPEGVSVGERPGSQVAEFNADRRSLWQRFRAIFA